MHSVFGIRSKRIKTRLYLQKFTLLCQFCLASFPSRSEYSKKISFQKKISILPTYPIFFSGCNLNHTYFSFGLSSAFFIVQVSLPASNEQNTMRHPALRRLVMEGRHGSILKGVYLEDYNSVTIIVLPHPVAQSVMCLTTDGCLTADPGVASFNLGMVRYFRED